MHVVIDARYLSRAYGGPAMYSEALLEHLARLDRRNEYTCLVRPDYDRKLPLGPNFRLLPYPAAPLSFATLLRLDHLLRDLRPDLFHALFPITPVFYRGKLAVTVHDLQPLEMPEWTGGRPWPIQKAYGAFYRWAYARSFRRADALIAVSRATKQALQDRFPRCGAKTHAILSGVPPQAAEVPDPADLESLRAKHALPDRFILYIGSTRPNKNLPNMLRAFARLREIQPESRDVAFVLVLTPDRFMKGVEGAIRRLGLEQAVRVLPPVSPREKRALYHSARLLFFATRFEGFGFPILEAQAQGTPVVAADDASLPEIAGGSALLVDPLDVEVMARGLARLLSDRHLRMKLAEKGWENLKRFSWERTAEQVLAIYREIG